MQGVSLAVSAFLLAACAGNPPKLPTEKISASKDIPLSGDNHVALRVASVINSEQKNSQNVLNVVSRSDTAQVVGLKALQFGLMLFSGGVGTQQVDGFSKENLKGTNIDGVVNPSASDLEPGLVALLNSVSLKPEAAGKAVKVSPGKFKLIYDGLNSDNYNFVYDTTITFSTDTTKGSYSYTCDSTSLMSQDRQKSYDEWTRDNYAQVRKVTQKLAEQCMGELNSSANKEKVVQALNGESSLPTS